MITRCARTFVLAALLVGGLSMPAHAQGQALREMYHTTWTARDGAPQAITELAQHPDGTLWIGTESGLFTFDGQTFRSFRSPPMEPVLPSGEIASLLVTRSGIVWASFFRVGIVQISGGEITVFSHAENEPFLAALQLREAPDGTIWAIDGNRLLRFGTDGAWRNDPTPSSGVIGGVFVDSANTLWLAQDGFLYRRPLAEASYTRTDVPADVVVGFTETPSGDIWVRDYDAATSIGRAQQVSLGGDRVRTLTQSLSIGGRVASTADGSLILSSIADGVRRLSPEEASLGADDRQRAEPDVFTREHGLSSNASEALLVDSHGNVWIGGARGLDRLTPPRVTLYRPANEGSRWAVCASKQGEVWIANTFGELRSVSGLAPTALPAIRDQLFSLACGDGGRAWFANTRGVWGVDAGMITALPQIPGAAQRKQIKVVATSDRTLYATVAGPFEDGSGIWRYQNDAWTRLPREGVLGAGGYTTYTDSRDRLWVGYENGQAILHTAAGAQIFASGEPGLGYVYAFLDTSRGLFAAGTNGLAVLRETRFEMLNFAEPSFALGVRGLVEARDGDLWLNAANGFTHVPVEELEAGLAEHTYPMKAGLVREGDYAGATQRVLGYLDTAARDFEGRLWFATANGVVHLDPERATAFIPPPIVTVRSATADGAPIGGDHAIAPGTRTLDIQYFGVNLTAPERVIYRYRLEGFDESWQEAGRRTEAIYTRLAPGTYTFSVMASNGDGVWSAPVSLPTLTVLPSFFQTWWFAAMIAVLVLLVVGIVHKARVRQIARVMNARFDERLAERTRVARELHDTLLQTVHGSKLVADRALRAGTDRDHLVHTLEQLSGWLGQAALEGRAALQSLRASTTEANNLAGAFRRAIDECRSDSSAEMALEVRGDARELHPVVRDEVYRIGYEAIRNACIHSRAKRIGLTLEYGHDLTLRISDDGVGIDPGVMEAGKEGHFGLRGMQERAERIGGKFTVVSGHKTGTVITLIVPAHIVFSAP